ncbi:Predicted nucleic acid-binding protein, contains PIN domain [Porphyromonadaceae bacterium KH3R12]|jgi:predicted nucleic acid-binding protein|uniref:type II toxin-antitoxin system VapC family toxin n=1 Tax=Proteiniphilum sp. TaxID=1926877 RepID=UPI000895098C|nr:PIN domain-containing protein [Proteiniphilum sp.]MDY9919452.1 PIN domain-containing protein [Proteiniphilum sp.]SEA03043.1 Predicted nucleic acid-binding protein, contains PIN domain [Porphyromonadaceae bacterium KH3R12]
MENLLIDTNIVVDLLSRRENFYQEAQELFTLADENDVKLFISALTFVNTHYLLLRHLSENEARKVMIKFKLLVKILPLEDKILELALASDFRDFEDAIQYHTALENKLNIIITRNKKDFKTSRIPVLTAKEYLNR